MSYDGVIFDLDGVLVDSAVEGSMEWFYQARVSAAQALGLTDFTREDAEILVTAASNQEVEDRLLAETDLTYQDLRRIETMRGEEKIDRVDEGDIGVIPGAEDVLTSFKDRGRPLAVVSNSTMQSLEHTLQELDLERYFDATVAPRLDEIHRFYDRRKPSPVMAEEVIEELGMEDPVMVGDSRSDIVMAERAGIDAVFFDYYGNGNPDPDAAYAITRITDLKEII